MEVYLAKKMAENTGQYYIRVRKSLADEPGLKKDPSKPPEFHPAKEEGENGEKYDLLKVWVKRNRGKAQWKSLLAFEKPLEYETTECLKVKICVYDSLTNKKLEETIFDYYEDIVNEFPAFEVKMQARDSD